MLRRLGSPGFTLVTGKDFPVAPPVCAGHNRVSRERGKRFKRRTPTSFQPSPSPNASAKHLPQLHRVRKFDRNRQIRARIRSATRHRNAGVYIGNSTHLLAKGWVVGVGSLMGATVGGGGKAREIGALEECDLGYDKTVTWIVRRLALKQRVSTCFAHP